MAEAVAEGVREVAGCEATIKRVPETLSDEILGKMGALESQKAMAHVPVASVEDLEKADAIIFGTPTRFGNRGPSRQCVARVMPIFAIFVVSAGDSLEQPPARPTTSSSADPAPPTAGRPDDQDKSFIRQFNG